MDTATASTIIDEDAEHRRASFWRRRIMLLRVEQLVALSGYAKRTIQRFESGEKVDGPAWRRYKLTCAGVHAQLRGWSQGDTFDWRV